MGAWSTRETEMNIGKVSAFAGAAALALVSLCGVAGATTIHVPADQPTIQAGIDAAAEGDTVLLADGTYTGPGNVALRFGKDIVLRSEHGPAATVIDGEHIPYQGKGMIFDAGETQSCVIEGLTIRRCDLGWSGYWGGGIACVNASSPTLRDLVIESNISMDSWWESGRGGGIWCDSASPMLEDVLLRGNISYDGAQLTCEGDAAPVLVRVTMQGTGEDGLRHTGLALYDAAVPSFTDVIIEGCWIGIFVSAPSGTLLENLTLRDNRGGSAAAIKVVSYGEPGELYLRNMLIHDSVGGAISARNTALVLENITIHRSRAVGVGAALHLVDGATANLTCCIVADSHENVAVYWDGEGATPTFECCVFDGNELGDVSLLIPDPIGQDGNLAANPLFCGLLHAPPFAYPVSASSPCLSTNNDCGMLIGAHGEGCGPVGAPEAGSPLTELATTNHPNPFNPNTSIRLALPVPARVTLRIHDATGRALRTLLAGAPQGAGELVVAWDGRDDSGKPLPSGVYFCEVEAGGYRAARKMTLLK